MGKIGRFFKTLDIFGRKTELKTNMKRKYKTKLGGFLTMAMIGLCVLLFINFGSDMMNHNNPTSIFAEIFIPFPEETYFQKEKNFFMFGIQAPNFSHFIDESYYNTTVVNARITLDGNSTFKNVPIERCTEESLPSDPRVYSYFLTAGRSPISDLYCIQREYDEKFKVSGAFDAPVYEFIDINIQACRNSSDPTATVCKPIEEIKAALSGYFAVFYLDYLMDPDNFENPGTPVGKDYFSPISVGVTRDTNRYYATTRVISDDGFLFTTKNEYLYPTVKLDKETFLIDSTESGQLVHFRMRKHHNEQVYNRRYKKVQNVMSEMGGFIQILYLIFLVITYPYVYKNYYEKIINTIYNFEIAEGGGDSSTNLRKNSSQVHSKYLSRDADENPKSKKKISTLEPLQHMFVSNANDNGKLELKKTLNRNMSTTMKKNERLMKYMLKLQNKPPLKTSFYRFLVGSFKSFFFKNSDLDEEFKYRQLEVGRDAISEKLDISYILKKFYEIDKLKMILLDKNQYHLFEYLPKPVIKKNYKIDLSYNNSTERNEQSKALKFIAHEKNVFSKAKKLYAAYNNIMSKEEISEMDRKLIDLLDDNVKTLLKQTSTKVFQKVSITEQIKMK